MKGSGKLVAVGNKHNAKTNQWSGIIISSDNDSTNWKIESTFDNVTLKSVASSNAKIVAVGKNYDTINDQWLGVIISSSNSEANWQIESIINMVDVDLLAIAANDYEFIAVGNNGILSAPAIIRSDNNGTNWTADTNLDSFNISTLNSITVNGNKFIAVGKTRYSTDNQYGVIVRINNSTIDNLIVESTIPTSDFKGIAANSSGKVVIVGNKDGTDSSDGIIVSSNANNTNWIVEPTIPDLSLNGITKMNDDGKFVVVGNGGIILASSNNGSSWVVESVIDGVDFKAIAANNNNKLVAVGESRDNDNKKSIIIMSSSNGGNNWVLENTGIININNPINVTVSNNKFIAIDTDHSNHSGLIISSDNNGSNWKIESTITEVMQLSGITANNQGQVVVVGVRNSGSAPGLIISSDNNGTNWTVLNTSSLPTSTILVGISARSNGEFVGSGIQDIINNGIIMGSSNNGLNWRELTKVYDKKEEEVLFGIAVDSSGRIVAIGSENNIVISNAKENSRTNFIIPNEFKNNMVIAY